VAISLYNKEINYKPIKVFTAFPELNGILRKVTNKSTQFVNSIISGRGVYKLSPLAIKEHPELETIQSKGHTTDVGTGAFKLLDNIIYFIVKPEDNQKNWVQILGLLSNKREYRWCRRDYLQCPDSFTKYKVFLPNSNGSGALGEVLSTPLIGEPLIGATETFLSIGCFDTKEEAQACLKYVKSKFARVMLGILKTTQHNTRECWKFVPLQDFTSHSDIDWSKSVHEIDLQLYKKYGLSAEEISFIETHVKEMA